MILELTGKAVQPGSFRAGVLTATNASLFPAVHASALSLKEQRVPYAVVSHSLTPEQTEILHSLDVMVLKENCVETHAMTASDMCPAIPALAWRKPFICAQSPFAMTAWIDADAIPLQYSQELFQWTRGFVTADHFVHDSWSDGIYQPLNDALGIDGHPLRINAGVLGFALNSEWMDTWRQVCNRVLLDRRLAKLAHCRDQSALVAALGSLPPGKRPTVLTQPHWNFPADGQRNITMHERLRDYPNDGPMLLDFARARHAGVSVVHWMGPLKPWAR